MKISYKINFIYSFRFMSSSLSSLVDNLYGGLHSDKRTDYKSCLDYMTTKDEKLIFRCFDCKKNYEKSIKESIKRFANIYEFCNEDINKFIFLLRIIVYPYEQMDNWERFNETSLLNKEAFYGSLNMDDFRDIEQKHAKRVFKNVSNKNLGDYYDLYVQMIHYY